jgi:hypothetical protein
MRKRTLFIIIVMGFVFVPNSVKAQSNIVNEQLIGRWELCTPNGKAVERPNVRQKIYTKNSYTVLEIDKNDNTTYVDFIGTITAQSEDRITETVIYVDSRTKFMMSRSFQFFYKNRRRVSLFERN